MPHLNFNPHYAVPIWAKAGTTLEELSSFPLAENDLVVAEFAFGSPIPIETERKQEEDLVDFPTAAVMIELNPAGTMTEDRGLLLLHEVRKGNKVYPMYFGCDIDDVLQVLLTEADVDGGVPFVPFRMGQHVMVPLRVIQITHHPDDYSELTWSALLDPVGEEVNGLISVDVQPAASW